MSLRTFALVLAAGWAAGALGGGLAVESEAPALRATAMEPVHGFKAPRVVDYVTRAARTERSDPVRVAEVEITYDNTTTSAGIASAADLGVLFGDDISMIGAGQLQALSFSIWNDSDATTPLETIDVEFQFLNPLDLSVIDSFTFTGLDLTDNGADPGLEPGYSGFYTISNLAAENIMLPKRFVAALVFSNNVGGGPRFGQSVYHPPTAGWSGDRFYRAGSWYYFGGDPYASFYFAFEVDNTAGPFPPVNAAYSNTLAGRITNFSRNPGAWIGDDLTLETGGVVDSVSFSVYSSNTATTNVMSLDVEVVLERLADQSEIGRFTHHVDYSAIGGLRPGWYSEETVTNLAPLGISINVAEVLIKARFFNVVGGTTLGQSIFNPPVVGSSADRFYLDDQTVNPPVTGWRWFSGNPTANFLWQVTVVEPQPFGIPVTSLPEIYTGGNRVPAEFWVDPPPSGQNSLQETPVILEYGPAQTVDFVLDDLYAGYPAGTLGLPGHTFIKWFFRGGDTGYFQNFDTIASVLNVGGYDAMQVVFDTFLSVDATVDGVAATKFITITPNGLNGNYSGNTPRTNLRFDPIDPTDLTNNYYEWVTLEAPAAPAGQAITYLLTYQDGTTTVFTPAEATPGRVSLRVEAFKTAVAQYTTVPTVVCGDTNCDGVVDTADIDNFVYVVVNNQPAPGCPTSLLAADTNGDGVVDTADIDSFVAAVINGGCL